MATYNTDVFAAGVPFSRTGVYPQVIPFSTANSPGNKLTTSALLGTSDLVGMFYVPTPGRICGYNIDFVGRFDVSTGLVLVLEDGQGNTYQSGITAGVSGTRLTDATALVGTVGQIVYTSPASAYLRLRPSTAASGGVISSRDLMGTALVKHE